MKIYDYTLNEIYKDEFGRLSGMLALNKPANITSHDLVDRVRKKLNIRKVGHAGALDPFATGLMIILVGKATKLSQKILTLEKEYEFDVLLGISTDTQDTEGKILKVKEVSNISKTSIYSTIANLQGSYQQEVPVFSSIKVNGVRLRELAHASENITKTKKVSKTFVNFKINKNTSIFAKLSRQKKLNNLGEILIELPKRKVDILEIEPLNIKNIQGKSIKINSCSIDSKTSFKLINVKTRVSKGTYIRQLAEDIGVKLSQIPSMLYTLNRTKVGKINQKDMIKIEDLQNR